MTALGVQLLLISYAAMLFKNTPDVSTRTNPYMVSEYRNSNVVFDQMVDDRIIRDCLTGEVVKDLRSRWAPETEHFMSEHDRTKTTGNNDLNRVNAFVGIFDKKMWGGDQDETGAGPVASGLGSTLNYAQEIIIMYLAHVGNSVKTHFEETKGKTSGRSMRRHAMDESLSTNT